jgi:hypothetical protein
MYLKAWGRNLFFVLLFASLSFLAACENFDWFRSEENLNEKIQHTWRFVPIPADTAHPLIEDWTFKSGVLYIKRNASGTLAGDTARYSIATDPDDSYLTIEGVNLRNDTLDSDQSKWDIIRLDDEVLFIVTDHYGTSPLIQREFYKND